MIKNSNYSSNKFFKQLFCKHDYRPYCETESLKDFEKMPYYLRKIMEDNIGVSADYKKCSHMWVSSHYRICIKCGKKIRKWNSKEEGIKEIKRLENLGLETNEPNL